MRNSSNKKYSKPLTIALSVIVTLWLSSLFLLKLPDNSHGAFGDMFGMVNALFSGLAFAGIIITILLQRDELSLQRKELEESRKVFQQQAQTMEEQKNETTFFKLLDNHREIVNSLKTGSDKIIRGNRMRGDNLHLLAPPPISGYEVLKNTEKSWVERFKAVSGDMTTGHITQLKYFDMAPLEFLADHGDTVALFGEIIHVMAYVIDGFPKEKQPFYLKTFWSSLSLPERFIFETYFENFPDKRSNVKHESSIYKKHKFVSFHDQQFPTLNITINRPEFESSYISMRSNLVVDKVMFLSYKQPGFYGPVIQVGYLDLEYSTPHDDLLILELIPQLESLKAKQNIENLQDQRNILRLETSLNEQKYYLFVSLHLRDRDSDKLYLHEVSHIDPDMATAFNAVLESS